MNINEIQTLHLSKSKRNSTEISVLQIIRQEKGNDYPSHNLGQGIVQIIIIRNEIAERNV